MIREVEQKRCLVIGDVHLCMPFKGYYEAQVATLKKIIRESAPTHVIFLGDIFHVRKPDPEVLLGVRKFFDDISNIPGLKQIFLLRGNHDSSNKSDDGVTALSLFQYPASKVEVITQTYYDHHLNFYFIPHYENQDIILDSINKIEGEWNKFITHFPTAPPVVFGHFGFAGCLNTANNADFDLDPSKFKYLTILGHIHKPTDLGQAVVLGTPYSTSFNECDYSHQCMLLKSENNKAWSTHTIPIEFGLRHLVMPYEALEANKEFIRDKNYATVLRVFISHFDEAEDSVTLRKRIMDEYGAFYVDIKFSAILDKKVESQSMFNMEGAALEINEDLIQKYIKENTTQIPESDILEGYKLINDYKVN